VTALIARIRLLLRPVSSSAFRTFGPTGDYITQDLGTGQIWADPGRVVRE
jgi:hypothetical protein